jgi:hypothetical protein
MRLSWLAFPAVAAIAGVTSIESIPAVRVIDVGPERSIEVRRIQAHFDSVLSELAGRDLSALAPSARNQRALLVETLQRYRARAEFPRNYDFPGQAMPYFVDRKTGILCAVAHLLESTGRRDIVDRVAVADNNVWVAELAGDREFEGWLAENGLTLDEAARIQVPYIGDPDPIAGTSRSSSYSPAAIGVLAGTAGASLFNVMRNSDGRGMIGTVLGMTAGAASIGMGAAAMGDPTAPRSVSTVSFIAGGLSAAIATRGYLRNRQYTASQRAARRGDVAVAPIVPVKGRNGAGLSLNVTF